MSFLSYQILQLKDFILCSLGLGFVLMLSFLVMAVRPKRGPAQYGIQAFFLNRSNKECIYLSCSFLQLSFAVSCLICRTELTSAHLMLAGALCVVKLCMLPSLLSFAADALYSVFLVFSLLAAGLLEGYLQQGAFDAGLLAVNLLLRIFILEYAVYDMLHSIQVMLGKETIFTQIRTRREKRKKKRELQKELDQLYG